MNIKGEEIIKQSAYLRGKFQFDDAIRLIEENISFIDPSIRVIALLEAFNAAQEKDDDELAKKYAKKIAVEEPQLPSIQRYL